jgi:hypothetical protein
MRAEKSARHGHEIGLWAFAVSGYPFAMSDKHDDQYTPEETARRRDEAIRRALNTPPKPQSEIVGKSGRKRRTPAKSRPAKKQ